MPAPDGPDDRGEFAGSHGQIDVVERLHGLGGVAVSQGHRTHHQAETLGRVGGACGRGGRSGTGCSSVTSQSGGRVDGGDADDGSAGADQAEDERPTPAAEMLGMLNANGTPLPVMRAPSAEADPHADGDGERPAGRTPA